MAQLKDLIVNGVGRFIGKVYASEFVGKLTGNADTATSAGNADTLDGKHASSFASSSHVHDYLPVSGGRLTGDVIIDGGNIPTGLSVPVYTSYGGQIITNMICKDKSSSIMYTSGPTDTRYDSIGILIGNGYLNTKITANSYLYLYSGSFISANSAIATGSDEKIKHFTDDILMDEEKLIKLFDYLSVKSYQYKNLKSDKINIGLSAQEVEAVLKELDIDINKYNILNIQYNYMLRDDSEEDSKYYTKFMSISYNDLYNLSLLKIKHMEESHLKKLQELDERLSKLEQGGNN